jgi:hypothetical protein
MTLIFFTNITCTNFCFFNYRKKIKFDRTIANAATIMNAPKNQMLIEGYLFFKKNIPIDFFVINLK